MSPDPKGRLAPKHEVACRVFAEPQLAPSKAPSRIWVKPVMKKRTSITVNNMLTPARTWPDPETKASESAQCSLERNFAASLQYGPRMQMTWPVEATMSLYTWVSSGFGLGLLGLMWCYGVVGFWASKATGFWVSGFHEGFRV